MRQAPKICPNTVQIAPACGTGTSRERQVRQAARLVGTSLTYQELSAIGTVLEVLKKRSATSMLTLVRQGFAYVQRGETPPKVLLEFIFELLLNACASAFNAPNPDKRFETVTKALHLSRLDDAERTNVLIEVVELLKLKFKHRGNGKKALYRAITEFLDNPPHDIRLGNSRELKNLSRNELRRLYNRYLERALDILWLDVESDEARRFAEEESMALSRRKLPHLKFPPIVRSISVKI